MEESKELAVIDPIRFLSEIESAKMVSQKWKLLNSVLNQPPIGAKNMNDQLKKAGAYTSKSTDYDYVPIGIVEEGLRQIFFGQVDFIIKNAFRDLNSFVTIASIRYKCPISGQPREVDGIGAKAIQQDKESKIGDFNHTMKQNGLELAVAISYSRAIKNAAKKLGKVFGGDLNRDDEGDIFFYNKEAVNHSKSFE